MPKRKAYALVYTASFQRHLKLVEAKYHALIRETLEKQLQFEPVAPTRNRKPLKKPMAFQAEWELRFGPAHRFRVFYTGASRSRHPAGVRRKSRQSPVH